MFLFGASMADVRTVEASGDYSYHCTVNPNNDLNSGSCRSAGNGNNACYQSGAGTACHGTLRLRKAIE